MLWAKIVFILSFLILLTLPIDPLLNQRYIVFPLSVVCLTLGLISMYYCTIPAKSKETRSTGGRP